jgi:hypothetical protein
VLEWRNFIGHGQNAVNADIRVLEARGLHAAGFKNARTDFGAYRMDYVAG